MRNLTVNKFNEFTRKTFLRSSFFSKCIKSLSKDNAVRLFTYLLITGIAFVFIYPFLYMIVNSIKSNADLFDTTIRWIPKQPVFENYVIAAKLMDYINYFKNSAIITVFSVIAQLISCSLIGYGFARYNFPFKNILFFFVLLSIIVPIQSIIIPLYMTYANFGWINSYLPMIVPCFFGFGLKGALFVFIFRQFYLGLPPDLENAARIDGCGFLRVYFKIVLPIAKSAYLVVLVLSLVWHWNDFYEPSIFLDNLSMLPLPNALYGLIEYSKTPPPSSILGTQATDVIVNSAVVMAGAFMVVTPMLAIYIIIQRQFIEGIERTGLVE